jgi:hypothetical protein
MVFAHYERRDSIGLTDIFEKSHALVPFHPAISPLCTMALNAPIKVPGCTLCIKTYP